MTTITMHRTVDAPRALVWDVITDHDLYAEAAPNLSTVEIVQGDGEGMVRRCVDTEGNEWRETCTRWNGERRFGVSVDVEDSDFHRRLFTRFDGEWRLAEADDGIRITMTFDVEPRYGPFGVLISRFFAYKAPGILEPIFDRWESEIRARTGTDTTVDHERGRGHDLTTPRR